MAAGADLRPLVHFWGVHPEENEALKEALDKEGLNRIPQNAVGVNWLRQSIKEHEVMRLAGHSSFATTHRYHLAPAADLVDRHRAAVAPGLCGDLLQKWCSNLRERCTKDTRQS